MEVTQVIPKEQYGCRSEHRQFSPGDQVLTLLPLQFSPFQAKFAGPYTVERQVSELNYLISTPNHRKASQLCYANLLKFYACDAPVSSGSVVHPVLMVDSELSDLSIWEGGLDSEKDTELPSGPVMCGRLKNSESLCQLEKLLSHPPASQHTELIALIWRFSLLFGDIPTQTSLIEHAIDVGDNPLIKQRFYHCS